MVPHRRPRPPRRRRQPVRHRPHEAVHLDERLQGRPVRGRGGAAGPARCRRRRRRRRPGRPRRGDRQGGRGSRSRSATDESRLRDQLHGGLPATSWPRSRCRGSSSSATRSHAARSARSSASTLSERDRALPPPPFPFIVGCGRSGSTLLRAMCDAHPTSRSRPSPTSSCPAGAAPTGRRDPPVRPPAFVDRLHASERFGCGSSTAPPSWRHFAAVAAGVLSAGRPDGLRAVGRRPRARRATPTRRPVYVLHIPSWRGCSRRRSFVHLIRDGRDVASLVPRARLGRHDRGGGAALAAAGHAAAGAPDGRCPPGATSSCATRTSCTDPATRLRESVRGDRAAVLPLDGRSDGSGRRGRPHDPASGVPPAPLDPADAGTARTGGASCSEQDVARFELLAGDTLAELGYERSGVGPSAAMRRDVAGQWVRWQLHRVRRRVGRAA